MYKIKNVYTRCYRLVGSTSLTALSDLDLLPDVLLSLQDPKEIFQASLEPWVLWAVATTEKSKHMPVLFLCMIISLAFMHEVLLNHLQDIAEEVQVTCSAQGTGSVCSATHVLKEMGSLSPLHLLQATLNFIYLFYTLPQPFLFQTEESSYRSSSTSQTI